MARTTVDPKKRQGHLRLVKAEMRYVSQGNSLPPGHVLYPELHKRWAWALAESGEVEEAIAHYTLSIKAKPDYAPAYAGLSDLYRDSGQPEAATKVLETGLQAKPNSKALKRRLQELEAQ